MGKISELNKSLINIILGFFMLIGAYLNDSNLIVRLIIYLLWMTAVVIGELTDYNFEKDDINKKLEKYFWIILMASIIVIFVGCGVGIII